MLTKLLLSALILYCFWCYKIVLFGCGKCPACRGEIRDPEADQQAEQLRVLCQRMPVRMLFIKSFVYGPLLIVTGPFIVPYSAVKLYLEDRQEAAKRRQHIDLTFAWTNPNKLPAHIREFFDLRTPELERLGFEFDGVYWMKPQHGDYYSALFINRSGTTIASLIHIYGDYHCSFSSILESGRCLETAPVEQTPKRESRFLDNPEYTVVFVPGQTTRSSYQQHQDKLAAIGEETSDRPLAFEAGQICDAQQYEDRVHSQQLHQFGDLDTPPPAPVLPEDLLHRADGCR